MFSNRLLQAIYEWSHPFLSESSEGASNAKEFAQIKTSTQVSEQFINKIDKSAPPDSIPLLGKSFLAQYSELSVCACHPELSLEKPLRIELVNDLQRQAEQILKLTSIGKPKSIRIVSVGSGMLLQEALIVIALAKYADTIYLDLIDSAYSFGHPNLSVLLGEFIHLIRDNCDHELIAGTLCQNAATRQMEKAIHKPYSDSNAKAMGFESVGKKCIIQFFHKIDAYVPHLQAPIYQQGINAESALLPQIGIEVDVYSYSEHGHCNINRLMSQMPHLATWYNVSTELDEKTHLFVGIRFQKSLKINESWLNVANEPIGHHKLSL